jgi:hypothetical protein
MFQKNAFPIIRKALINLVLVTLTYEVSRLPQLYETHDIIQIKSL